jgi:hypothetical protein
LRNEACAAILQIPTKNSGERGAKQAVLVKNTRSSEMIKTMHGALA